MFATSLRRRRKRSHPFPKIPVLSPNPQSLPAQMQSLKKVTAKKVAAITRDNWTFIPVSGTEFREGDVMHLAVIPSAMVRLEELLGLERM